MDTVDEVVLCTTSSFPLAPACTCRTKHCFDHACGSTCATAVYVRKAGSIRPPVTASVPKWARQNGTSSRR